MRPWLNTIAIIITISSFTAVAQPTDSLATKLDSLKKQSDTTGQTNIIEPSFYNERTKMNAKVFGILLLNDFKQQALSPFDIKGKDWPLGAGLVASTVLMGFFVDNPVQEEAVRIRRRNPNLGKIANRISTYSGVSEVAYFGFFAVGGFVFKAPKFRTTTALATQSYITTAFWSTLFKTISGRRRPNPADTMRGATSFQSPPTFHGPFASLPYGGNSAFPSGHTALAFAAARVYAMEYRHKWWVPALAYTTAASIGLSRIIENRHWTTDVFAGALLGWACGTQVVNNYHRYAKLVRTGGLKKKKKKGDLSINIQYQPGIGLQPGVLYSFR